ncbi:hypothetical protein [Leptospira kmetyi]|uniref:hypothetical protein n=1 Tax=Leptospira kmetyi TaxID=408139 RepID=UPI0010840CE7|nr:hypothetical protein [Leptospira kmetyi]TGL68522.1 hypothetical protein EHQ67_11390 [Leptospira kmetyi]
MKDLWPEKFEIPDNLRPPSKILEEQGVILEEKTFGKLRGVLQQTKTLALASTSIEHKFSIFSPTLNYLYSFLSISHEIELYPVELEIDLNISKELGWPTQWKSANNPDEFMKLLSEIFKTERLNKVISAIMAQS